MITGHECNEDYDYFYRSLAGIVALPYLMQDASKAEYGGIKSVFQTAILIMGYT